MIFSVCDYLDQTVERPGEIFGEILKGNIESSSTLIAGYTRRARDVCTIKSLSRQTILGNTRADNTILELQNMR